jgi:uncharacterized membrane protein YukC
METYKPAMPEVRDNTARILLWVVLALTVVNVVMVGYVFYVVHHTVAALQQIGDAFNQVAP